MFGIGPLELIVVGIIGLVLIAAPIAVVLFLVAVLRENKKDYDAASDSDLRAENERLREENKALRRGRA